MNPVAVAALVVAVLALAVGAFALVRLSQVQKQFRTLGLDEDANQSVASVLAKQNKRIDEALASVENATSAARGATASASQALRHVALVRYDAFGDAGGRLSFSAALLDDAGDGLVISSIHARNESRTYAKSLSGGASSQELTPEEQEAVAAARSQGSTS